MNKTLVRRSLCLFDLDGTILDSVGIIHDSMVLAFEEAGFEAPTENATRSIIGLTLNLAIAQLLDRAVDAQVETMTARYKEHFHALYGRPDFSQSLFDGMGAVLDQLAQIEGYELGIVTGKSRRGMDMFFDKHGFKDHFEAIRTADDCPSKPHPAMVLECCAQLYFEPRDTIVVGDSVFDMQMAKAAGAYAVGVAWGYNDIEALRGAGADVIADDAAHLMQILEQVHA